MKRFLSTLAVIAFGIVAINFNSASAQVTGTITCKGSTGHCFDVGTTTYFGKATVIINSISN